MTKKRMANIELLRVLAMMMVVMLHFLGKGKLLPEAFFGGGVNGYLAWVLESFAVVAVNVYVLISGYFLVESDFRVGKVISIIAQVLFYTILIPVIGVAVGILPVSEIGIYQLLLRVLPVQMEHYWFVTTYVLLYLISPVLAMGIKALTKKQFERVLLAYLFVVCGMKSILPVALSLDKDGYDLIWFICVFMIAAYIRLYGIPMFSTKAKSILWYLVFTAAIFGESVLIAYLYQITGRLDELLRVTYDYNHIFNIAAAVALFYAFLHMKNMEGGFGRFICTISPYTLGVYLLHEELTVRNLWPVWFGAGRAENPVMFVLHAIFAVVAVFVIGICVDYIRSLIFKGVVKLFKSRKA